MQGHALFFVRTAAGCRGRRGARALLATTRHHGVSLIEGMVVLVIIGVLLAGSIPNVARWVAAHHVATAINDLAHAIALARSEALQRNGRVYVGPPTGKWRDGWAVYVDRNDNRVFDAVDGGGGDELIALHGALPASVSVGNTSGSTREPFTDLGRPQRSYVLFDGSGYPRQRNGGFNAGGIVVTARVGDATIVRALCMASFGRVRIVDDRTTC